MPVRERPASNPTLEIAIIVLKSALMDDYGSLRICRAFWQQNGPETTTFDPKIHIPAGNEYFDGSWWQPCVWRDTPDQPVMHGFSGTA